MNYLRLLKNYIFHPSSQSGTCWLLTNLHILSPVSESEVARHVRLFVTTWTVVYWAPPSMKFSKQEYWSRLPFPYPGHLPDQGVKPRSPALQPDTLPSEPPAETNHLQLRPISKMRLSFTSIAPALKPCLKDFNDLFLGCHTHAATSHYAGRPQLKQR